MHNQEERKRLKEQYKQHYRKIKQAKRKIRRTKTNNQITGALRQLNNNELMESMSDFVDGVQDKVARVEARLEIALDSLMDENEGEASYPQNESLATNNREQRARETLRKVKNEMGMLYRDMEEQAEKLNVDKTVGQNSGQADSEHQDEHDISTNKNSQKPHNDESPN